MSKQDFDEEYMEAMRQHEEMVEAQVEAKDNPEALLEEVEQKAVKEKEEAVKEDPYYLGDLAEEGYKTDGTGIYVPYIPPIYLKLTREDEKTFGYGFYLLGKDGKAKQYTKTYTKQKPITEDDPKRNQTLGRYTKQENMPRGKGEVKSWLEQVEMDILKADGLAIIKDKHYYPVDTETTTEEEETEETPTEPQTVKDYPENIQRLATQVRVKGELFDRLKKTTSYRLEGNEEEVKLVTYGIGGLFCGAGNNILAGGSTGIGKTKTIMEVLDNFPDQYIYNLNTSPKYIFRDAENLEGYKIIVANDIPLTQANIDLIKAFSRKEDKISYKTLDKGKDGKQERLVLEIEGKYIVIMTFAKNTPDDELANPFFNMNIAPDKEESHRIKDKIAEQNITDGLHNEGYNIANEINKCAIQWLIEQDFKVFNPYTLFLNPHELNNRDIDNLLSFVKGGSFFKYSSRRKINIKGKKVLIGSYEDFEEIVEIWRANTEVQKYKLDSIQESVLNALPTLTRAEAKEELQQFEGDVDYVEANRNAKKYMIDSKKKEGKVTAMTINELAHKLGKGKTTLQKATTYEEKGTNKPCLASLGLIDYYELDNGYGHPQRMLYCVGDENENAPNRDLALVHPCQIENELVNLTLNQKRSILITLMTGSNILINKSIGGVVTTYCSQYTEPVTTYDEMVDFIDGFFSRYNDELEFVNMDTITLDDLDYHNNILKNGEGGTLLDTFSPSHEPVTKTEENPLNQKQDPIDSFVLETAWKNESEIGKEAISENDPTPKSMENAQNLSGTNSFFPDDELEQQPSSKSGIEEILTNSGIDVEMGSAIVMVVASDDGELTRQVIRQQTMHKLDYHPDPTSDSDPIILKFDRYFDKLVDTGLLGSTFTSGTVFYLCDELKNLLRGGGDG